MSSIPFESWASCPAAEPATASSRCTGVTASWYTAEVVHVQGRGNGAPARAATDATTPRINEAPSSRLTELQPGLEVTREDHRSGAAGELLGWHVPPVVAMSAALLFFARFRPPDSGTATVACHPMGLVLATAPAGRQRRVPAVVRPNAGSSEPPEPAAAAHRWGWGGVPAVASPDAASGVRSVVRRHGFVVRRNCRPPTVSEVRRLNA